MFINFIASYSNFLSNSWYVTTMMTNAFFAMSLKLEKLITVSALYIFTPIESIIIKINLLLLNYEDKEAILE
jgi:hypothetical protein